MVAVRTMTVAFFSKHATVNPMQAKPHTERPDFFRPVAWISDWLKQCGPITKATQHWHSAVDSIYYAKHVCFKKDDAPPPRIGDFQQTPVMLVHGFLGRSGAMQTLCDRLKSDRFTISWAQLDAFNLQDIRKSAHALSSQIEALLERTNKAQTDIVAHSMGGLIALYYIKYLGGETRIRRLVLLGTPVNGTWSAYVGTWFFGLLSPSIWQLLPDNAFVRALKTGGIPKSVACFSIAGNQDWICPPSTTKIEGATSILVPAGHASLVINEQTYHTIRELLRPDKKNLDSWTVDNQRKTGFSFPNTRARMANTDGKNRILQKTKSAASRSLFSTI